MWNTFWLRVKGVALCANVGWDGASTVWAAFEPVGLGALTSSPLSSQLCELSVPQFSYFQNGNNNSTCLPTLQGPYKDLKHRTVGTWDVLIKWELCNCLSYKVTLRLIRWRPTSASLMHLGFPRSEGRQREVSLDQFHKKPSQLLARCLKVALNMAAKSVS